MPYSRTNIISLYDDKGKGYVLLGETISSHRYTTPTSLDVNVNVYFADAQYYAHVLFKDDERVVKSRVLIDKNLTRLNKKIKRSMTRRKRFNGFNSFVSKLRIGRKRN